MTTIIKCKDCNNDFEKTSENFYASKGVLQTTRCKKCKAKQIYQINKRKGNDYSKYRGYYQTYMKEYNKKIISCECGSNITRGRIREHIKTKIHARRLNDLRAKGSDKVSLPSSS
jgi:hypothetical protein